MLSLNTCLPAVYFVRETKRNILGSERWTEKKEIEKTRETEV
jgi:hypothetical protein